MRLVQNIGTINNSLYIPPAYFGDLAGLRENGTWKYGFRLLMTTALNITSTPLREIRQGGDTYPTAFSVNVKSHTGKTAPNALVSAKYFCIYINKTTDSFDYFYQTLQNITDWNGNTTLSFDVNNSFIDKVSSLKGKSQPSTFLFLTANYYGIQSQAVQQYPQIPTLDLMLQGQYLIASFLPGASYPKSAHHLGAFSPLIVIQFTTNLDVILNPVTNVTGHGQADLVVNKGGKDYRTYQLSGYSSPDVLFAGIMVTTRGRDWFAFASRPLVPTAIDYRSHTFPVAGIKTEVLSRVVRMGQNSYVVDLTVWRMGE